MKKNKENYNIWWEEDLTDEIRDMFKKKLYDLVSDCNKIQFDNSLSNEIKNLKNTIKKLEKELLDINDETENIISKERETYENKRLKLTEKEITTILYLLNIKKEVSVSELQEKVWGYQKELETHTVETHIHRLRKKIFNTFSDNNFIISNKNGYQIN